MKKYLKTGILTLVIIIFGIISFLYFQNRSIENQPKKAKLVINIGGDEYGGDI